MKNRVKFWRLQLQAKEGRTITQGEFSLSVELSRETISRYEHQRQQPDLENLVKIWLYFRTHFSIQLQDLLDEFE